MSSYNKDLDPSQKEIRRLILKPGNDGMPIECSAEVISLSDHPNYEALSYVWGDATMQSIIFDGSPFQVTENLAIALRHLRLPAKPRKLWIDALCINQSNFEERNEQVRLMGEIYASAKPVLIWLGEAEAGSDEAFDLISTIVDQPEMEEEVERKLFSFYLQLRERKWFTRLWTVQEMVLARDGPLVGCGYKWITWSTLFRVWHSVAKSEFGKMGMLTRTQPGDNGNGVNAPFSVPSGSIKVDLLNNLRTAISTKGGSDLQNLLAHTITSQVTEPRDRIYALLGMMEKEDRESITVDYSRPLGVVYAEAIARLCQKGQGLFFLSKVELAGLSANSCYPSWAPKFGGEFPFSPLRLQPPGIGASGAGSECANGTVDPDLKTFRVRGLHIDVIANIVAFEQGVECLKQLPQVEALATKAHQLAASSANDRSYLNAFKTKEPLWRTLIANKAYSGAAREEAPESYRVMYEALLSDPRSADESIREYRLALLNHLPSGYFFITETGFCGISQEPITKGDHLAIWFGAPVPFILRPKADTKNTIYAVIGAAYVAGIMDGEMVDEVYCEDLEDDIVFVVR